MNNFERFYAVARETFSADVSPETNLMRVVKKLGGSYDFARVSSAQARGYAKKFSYWGRAIYSISVNDKNHASIRCREGAMSRRRSIRLAEADCEASGFPIIVHLSFSDVAREIFNDEWYEVRK